jgi:glycosyltransferase involved in cell wall biosynthesis
LTRLLFITSRFPYPLNKGDKLRVYFQLQHLAKSNEIHLIALNETKIPDDDLAILSPYCKSINLFIIPQHQKFLQLFLSLFKGIPLQVAFFYNSSVKKKIEQLAAEIEPDHIHCHLIRTTEYVKHIDNIKKSLDFMDAFGRGMEKRQTIESNIFKRLLYTYEKKQLYKYEAKVFHFVDKFCIISEQDKNLIKSPRATEIDVIPNGVDFETFYPKAIEKEYDLLFMGNLGYPPNIDAVLFLVNEIIPLVKKEKPDAKLLIAGVNAPKRIRKLASDGIDVIENFENISTSIAISKIMLAPMKISIGLQNKILQAMAMKTPCIVSTLSNNAINAPNNKAIIEANSPIEFSKAIIELLSNREKALQLGEEGYRFVQDHYSWEKQNDLFIKLILNQN